jgi:hypothetical protein
MYVKLEGRNEWVIVGMNDEKKKGGEW